MGRHLREVCREVVGPGQGAAKGGGRMAHPPHGRIREELHLVHAPLHRQHQEAPLALVAAPVKLSGRRGLVALDLRVPAAALAGPGLAGLVLHSAQAPHVVARDGEAQARHRALRVRPHPVWPEPLQADVACREEQVRPGIRLTAAPQCLAQPRQRAAPALPLRGWPAEQRLGLGSGRPWAIGSSAQRLRRRGAAHPSQPLEP
mmetsp:Transcript_61559/g.148960  ORF Transcript_61559/g.148960 Transcript_61559/m.148960 type:complete len:203 (+) Transcript_61559:1472-2080(+)